MKKTVTWVIVIVITLFLLYLGLNYWKLQQFKPQVVDTLPFLTEQSTTAPAAVIALPTGPALVAALQGREEPFVVGHTLTAVQEFEIIKNDFPALGFLTQDQINFVAYGQASAGINVSEMGPDAIRVEGTTAVVYLPPMRLFPAPILDTQQSFVKDRNTGVFIFRPDQQFETQIRRQSEAYLLAAMEESGLYTTAEAKIKTWLSGWLLGIGFTDVEFR